MSPDMTNGFECGHMDQDDRSASRLCAINEIIKTQNRITSEHTQLAAGNASELKVI